MLLPVIAYPEPGMSLAVSVWGWQEEPPEPDFGSGAKHKTLNFASINTIIDTIDTKRYNNRPVGRLLGDERVGANRCA